MNKSKPDSTSPAHTTTHTAYSRLPEEMTLFLIYNHVLRHKLTKERTYLTKIPFIKKKKKNARPGHFLFHAKTQHATQKRNKHHVTIPCFSTWTSKQATFSIQANSHAFFFLLTILSLSMLFFFRKKKGKRARKRNLREACDHHAALTLYRLFSLKLALML